MTLFTAISPHIFLVLIFYTPLLPSSFKQVISPDEDDGVNISVNPFKTSPQGAGGVSAEDMMIDGPKIPIEELISLMRHSKLATIKEALDYLPNKKFDKSLVQVRANLCCFSFLFYMRCCGLRVRNCTRIYFDYLPPHL